MERREGVTRESERQRSDLESWRQTESERDFFERRTGRGREMDLRENR